MLQMLTSKDANFIGYTFKNSDMLKAGRTSGELVKYCYWYSFILVLWYIILPSWSILICIQKVKKCRSRHNENTLLQVTTGQGTESRIDSLPKLFSGTAHCDPSLLYKACLIGVLFFCIWMIYDGTFWKSAKVAVTTQLNSKIEICQYEQVLNEKFFF